MKNHGKFHERLMIYVLTGLIVCCTGLFCHAELEVRDGWETEEIVTVSGKGWQAEFHKGGALRVESDDQSIAIKPLPGSSPAAAAFTGCEIVTNDTDKFEARVTFDSDGRRKSVHCKFANGGLLEWVPADNTTGLAIQAEIAVGILPGKTMEDVLYHPDDWPDRNSLHVPSENWFAAGLQGEGGMVFCAWPGDAARLTLALACLRADTHRQAGETSRIISSVDFDLNGSSLYLQLAAAPGLWHKENVKLNYLEKRVALDWCRPVNAVYRTQLPLKGRTTTPRTFNFRNHEGDRWRPETGNFIWPVWFEGDQGHMFLSKKIPPKEDAVFYPFEGHAKSLCGFLARTPVNDLINRRCADEDVPGTPPMPPNVGYNACWGTHLLRWTIYTEGVQARERVFLPEHGAFLAAFDAKIQTRNAWYFRFVDDMRNKLTGWLETEQDKGVRGRLQKMLEYPDRIEAAETVLMKLYGDSTAEQHIAHAERNLAQLEELLGTPGPELYPEFERLMDEFNRLGWGHNESTGMRFSMLNREWAQDIALGCADLPDVLEYAEQLRADIRVALNRTPTW